MPDGRTAEQQRRFFTVEVKPQAIEKHFCHVLQLSFQVSVDNLGCGTPPGMSDFREAVDRQFYAYLQQGLPPRAAAIAMVLSDYK